MLIIQPFIAFEGVYQFSGGAKDSVVEHLGDAPVEAFDHTDGMGAVRVNEVVVDAVGSAELLKLMLAGKGTLAGGTEAVGELFAIIRQNLGNFERGSLEQLSEKCTVLFDRLAGPHLQIYPAAGAYTQRLARSMPTHRYWAWSSSGMRGRYLISTWTKPGS